MLLFGYGSLMNNQSLAKTSAAASIIDRVQLHGYQRKVNAMHEAFPEVAMNIVPNSSFAVTGVLIDLPESDLPAMRKRETGYDMVEVSESISGVNTAVSIYTFIAPNVSEYGGKCVSREYLQLCLAGVPEPEREQWLLETVVECGVSDAARNEQYRHA